MLTFPFTIPILEQCGFRSEKLYPCFPVVNISRFSDRSLNGSAVMNIGACRPKKNMADFIRLALLVSDKEFNLYALGTDDQSLHVLKNATGSQVNIRGVIQPPDMATEYKKHEWLVYTACPRLNTVGWPVAIAEAQAAGVGVCMQRIRPDFTEYVGDAGYLFETIEEAAQIISKPFPAEKRELGFQLAKRSDVQSHINVLLELWKSHLS